MPEEKLQVNRPFTWYYLGPNVSHAHKLFGRLDIARENFGYTRLEYSSNNFKSTIGSSQLFFPMRYPEQLLKNWIPLKLHKIAQIKSFKEGAAEKKRRSVPEGPKLVPARILLELEKAPDRARRPGPEENLMVNKLNTQYYQAMPTSFQDRIQSSRKT